MKNPFPYLFQVFFVFLLIHGNFSFAQNTSGRVECRPESYNPNWATYICSSGTAFSYQFPGQEIYWQVSGAAYLSSTQGNHVTAYSTSNGTATITALIYFGENGFGSCRGWHTLYSATINTVVDSNALPHPYILGKVKCIQQLGKLTQLFQ